MKLVVLLSRFPFPLEKGDKLRAYQQLKELTKHHELHVVCLSDKTIAQPHLDEVRQFCKSLHVFRMNKALIYWNTVKQVFTDKPYQVGYFYQKSIQKKINALIREIQPDHIYCQLIRTAEYVKNIQHIKKTIDYMDALGKGMFRRAEMAGGIRRSLFRIEGKRLSEYENRIFDYFNHHTIISEQDRNYISHINNQRIVIIENGISDHFFSYDKPVEKKYDLVFTGNLSYAPNVACAEFIVNQVLPVLRQTKPKTTVLISGADPHPRITQLAGPGVTVSGWVEDIRDSYAAGKIFVAPLFIGTGLQNKLLEAMAMGIPCVTTDLARNAFGTTGAEIMLTAESAAGFAKKINALLDQPELSQRLSTDAKNYVRESFSWEHSVKKLRDLFESK
jgi:polysaccharide biosynthesis protein PslH